MDIATKIIGALGVLGVARGAMGAWNGWEEYSAGKRIGKDQKIEQGWAGMLYGAATAALSTGIAAGIVALLNTITW